MFVCLFVNTITSERLNVGYDETWQLHALYKNLARVGVSRSKAKVTGDKKRKIAAYCSGVVLRGAVFVRHFFGSGLRGLGPPPVLRRWENQRMLSSWYTKFCANFTSYYYKFLQLLSKCSHCTLRNSKKPFLIVCQLEHSQRQLDKFSQHEIRFVFSLMKTVHRGSTYRLNKTRAQQ